MIVAREQVRQDYNVYRKEKQKRAAFKQGKSLNRRRRVGLTALVLLAFVTGVVISFYYAQVLVTGYRIHYLQNKLAALQKETDDLQGEIARLNSMERIEKVATQKLGMVRPGSSDVIKVGVTSAAPVQRTGGSEIIQRDKGKPGQQEEGSWVIQAFTDLVQEVKNGISAR